MSRARPGRCIVDDLDLTFGRLLELGAARVLASGLAPGAWPDQTVADRDGVVVEVHHAGLAGVGAALDQALAGPVVLDQADAAADLRPAGVEVDVAPAEGERFPAPAGASRSLADLVVTSA